MVKIKIFLTELDPAEINTRSSATFAFWTMLAPVLKEIASISKLDVEKAVLDIFEVESAKTNISDLVYVKVYDDNDNKIFGGTISKEGGAIIYPIIETFQS